MTPPPPSISEAVLAAILDVAPDLEGENLDLSADLQQDLGLDSIDLLNIAGRIEARTGVEISDTDFSDLRRISSLIAFVESKSAASA
jgi:acyl carrier protein